MAFNGPMYRQERLSKDEIKLLKEALINLIDEQEPLMIGQYHISGTAKIWYIGRQRYTAGTGIDVIKHIPKPRNK